jgi:NTE family protein
MRHYTPFNPYLRSDAYGAIGLTPIYRINDQIHLRFQNYLYAPLSYFKWYPKDNKTINEYNKLVYMSEVSLVAQFNFLTISIYSNYYNHPNNDFNYGLNIGFLIPNTRLIER